MWGDISNPISHTVDKQGVLTRAHNHSKYTKMRLGCELYGVRVGMYEMSFLISRCMYARARVKKCACT